MKMRLPFTVHIVLRARNWKPRKSKIGPAWSSRRYSQILQVSDDVIFEKYMLSMPCHSLRISANPSCGTISGVARRRPGRRHRRSRAWH